jgi:glyoxylase I family protein
LSDNINLKLHHVSLIVSDTEKALAFYRGILGLKTCQRPDLPFPGAWLELNDQQIHLLELPNPDPVSGRPEHGGRDRHTAFTVSDITVIQQRLEQKCMTYTKSISGRQALFCRDPDGNAIEFIQTN